MKNTHTPGPWAAAQSIRGYWFIEHLQGKELYTLTRLDCAEQDARLIAAAPDMLEALRAIATYMRGDLTADDFKAFGLKRGDLTGNVRRIAETVLTRIDGEAAQ